MKLLHLLNFLSFGFLAVVISSIIDVNFGAVVIILYITGSILAFRKYRKSKTQNSLDDTDKGNSLSNIEKPIAYEPTFESKSTYKIQQPIYKHNLKDRKNKYDYVDNPIKDYVVIDTETTGRSAQMDHIIEISAIRIRDGQIVNQFQSLINPQVMIPKGAIKVHGITDDMVANAPPIYVVLPQFLDFIGNDVLLGHNITFDLRFINSYLDDNLNNKLIDTMRVAKEKLPHLENYKLITLMKYFNLSENQQHRSLSDCVYTYQLYELLKNI